MALTRPSVKGAVLIPEDVPEMSAMRKQLANTSHSQTHQQSHLIQARRAQSERSRAALTSEMQEVRQKLVIRDEELMEAEMRNRQLKYVLNNLMISSTDAETKHRQEIEESELDFATMQSLYMDQVADAKEKVKAAIPHAAYEALQQEVNCLHDKLATQEVDLDDYKRNSKGLAEETLEMRVENNQLMEDVEVLTRTKRSLESSLEASQLEVKGLASQVTWLQYQLGMVLECGATPTSIAKMASPFGGSKVDSPLHGATFAQDCEATPTTTAKMASPVGAVARTPYLSEIGSPATPSSSVACFFSDVVMSPLLTRPTPSVKEMLASPTPLPAYIKWEAAANVVAPVYDRQAGTLHVELDAKNPRKLVIRRRPAAVNEASSAPTPTSPIDALPRVSPPSMNASSPSQAGHLLAASLSQAHQETPAAAPYPGNLIEVNIKHATTANKLPLSYQDKTSPAELATAADTMAGRGATSPVRGVPSPNFRQFLSPAVDVQTLCPLGTSPGVDKPSPMGARPGRPALANLTNMLTPKAGFSSGSPAGLQQALSMANPSPLARVKIGGALAAAEGFLPETAARKAALAALLGKGSASIASTNRSRRSSGSEGSPGTPPGFDFNSPARGPFSRQRVSSSLRAVSSTVPSRACGSTPTAPATAISSPSLLASSSRTKTASSSVMSPGHANRRGSTSSSIGDRPAWRSHMSLSPALPPSPARATPPARLPSTASQRKAVAQQPSPSPVSAGSTRPAATAASQPATARPRASSRIGQVTASAAGGKAAQSTVEGSHRAGLQGRSGATRPGPTRGAAAPTKAAKAAVVGVAGRRGAAPVSSAPDGGQTGQVRKGRGRSVKSEAPTRVQPARRAKAPQHAWRG